MNPRSPGFHVSWVIVPAAFALGLFLLLAHVLVGRAAGLGWALLVAPPVICLLGLARIPVDRRLRRLREAKPDAIVELVERGGALSKDLAKINAVDGLERDTRFRTICLVVDDTGVSAWRARDVSGPEWTFSWDRLTAPVASVVNDGFLSSGLLGRGLELAVTVDGGSYRLRLVFLGAGFFGFFALPKRELEAIATRCSELRETALAAQ